MRNQKMAALNEIISGRYTNPKNEDDYNTLE